MFQIDITQSAKDYLDSLASEIPDEGALTYSQLILRLQRRSKKVGIDKTFPQREADEMVIEDEDGKSIPTNTKQQ